MGVNFKVFYLISQIFITLTQTLLLLTEISLYVYMNFCVNICLLFLYLLIWNEYSTISSYAIEKNSYIAMGYKVVKNENSSVRGNLISVEVVVV